jgi:hypothetical protein
MATKKKKTEAPKTWREFYALRRQLNQQSIDFDRARGATEEVRALHVIAGDICLIRMMYEHMLPGLEKFFYGTAFGDGSIDKKARSAAAGGK